jgi:hypothetical protein
MIAEAQRAAEEARKANDNDWHRHDGATARRGFGKADLS